MTAGALPLALAAPAAAATTELFFSEYVEGSSNNKALEIYNGTGAPVSLSGYSVRMFFNGSTSAGTTISLSGTVADGDVFVIAHGSAVAAVKDAADLVNSASWYNGDDAIALAKDGVNVDVIGQIGFDPGSEWGTGLTSTADNTLRRKTSVTAGDPDGSDPFDPSVEWDGFATDTFDGLGWHIEPGGEEPPGEEPGGECGEPATLVHDIQGAGTTSPMVGQRRTVEGVVTATKRGLNGYYVQEEADDVDADPRTSEGIFVFVGSANAIPVEEGDVVRVTGTVGEYTTSGGASQTQLASSTVQLCDELTASVEPTPVSFPLEAAGDLERYEGMLVQLVDELVISEYFNYDRFGEVVLAKPLDGRDRLDTPTAVVEPGDEARQLAAEYQLRKITLDDANGSQNPATVPHPGNGEDFSAENTFRGGDTVTGVTGVIDHTFGLYRIQPTEFGDYEAKNPRPQEAPEVGGSVQVASFNVLNYFLTLTTEGNVCGASQRMECRGANSELELERQRTKLLAALAGMDADVVGLMEMENTPGVEPAADLVEGLNDLLGEGTYDYVDTGVIGTDAIRLGYLYKPGTVEPVGDFAVLDSSVDTRFDDQRNRPMLTQTFDEVATGERFTVSINHLKSKGSACGATDPDRGDGQGNCNLTREAAAEAIVDFLASDPTGSGDPDHLVIGDLNSYDHEDPIRALEAGGYTDLVKKFGGEYAYGYVFDGMVGYLDHALSSVTLTSQVTGTSEWHINADEPDILDYNLDFGRPGSYWTPDPYRSSDHDPVLVGLDLDGDAACYADGAQSVEDYSPGVRANGTAVPVGHADPSNALGLPDPQDDEAYWTTLGLGGEIVLEFANPVHDAAGADLRILDVEDGAKGRADSATVYASNDGTTWVELGSVTGTGEVDLEGFGTARYIKVVDTTATTTDRLLPATDGYDLDAIEVLTGCG